MKRIIYNLSILICLVLVACSSTKDTANTSSTNESAAAAPQEAVSQSQAQEIESSDIPDNERIKTVKGNDIIRRTLSTLKSRLELNEDQSNVVNEQLTSSFISAGYKLDEGYSVEDARTMSKQLIANSKDSIIPILDETQKGILNKLLN